jgi:hypothetical protein
VTNGRCSARCPHRRFPALRTAPQQRSTSLYCVILISLEEHVKPSTKEREHYYFEMFRGHYPLPDGAIEYGDKPDVIVRGQKTIGIEITNFYLEDGSLIESEQVQRSLRDSVVLRAQRIYREEGGRGFELWFGFDVRQPIRDQDQLSRKLADLARRIETQATGEVRRSAYQDIPELSSVSLNAQEYADSPWRVSQLYYSVITPADRLKDIIGSKETKLQGYRPCDAFWLLLIVDFIDRAQDQQLSVEEIRAVKSTVFERIIVYKTHFGEIVEVH